MLKIIRVGALDGNKLDIELSNGSLILFDMHPLMAEPDFAALLEDDRILYPRTDGSRVYWQSWQNGPSITVERLMQLIQTP